MTHGAQGDGVRQRIDVLTIIGLGAILMPLTTMWHEIGGHAAACLLVGGRPSEIGAFYVDCVGDGGWGRIIVACAGVTVDAMAAVAAWALWRRARSDLGRLVLWYIWIGKGLVAAGYFCFSAISGLGDLGPGLHGGIGPLPMPLVWRAGFLLVGGAVYWQLVSVGIRALTVMLGDSAETGQARRRIAHVYYGTVGIVALAVGLLNPIGVFITILSAAASSFGGHAGLISIGFATPHGTDRHPYVIRRHYGILIAGAITSVAFAVVLGPTLHLYR